MGSRKIGAPAAEKRNGRSQALPRRNQSTNHAVGRPCDPPGKYNTPHEDAQRPPCGRRSPISPRARNNCVGAKVFELVFPVLQRRTLANMLNITTDSLAREPVSLALANMCTMRQLLKALDAAEASQFAAECAGRGEDLEISVMQILVKKSYQLSCDWVRNPHLVITF